MSAAVHTPGPWKAHPTGLARSGLPEFEIHWSDIGECVAEIVHGEADARLIAAAPTLLMALEFLLEQAESFNVSGVYFNAFRENRDALDTAHDAIAEATGSNA